MDCDGVSGADDASFAAAPVRKLGLIGAAPRQDLLTEPRPHMRAAVSTDGSRAAIYLPSAVAVPLTGVAISNVRAWNLAARTENQAEVTEGPHGPVLSQPEWNADSLFVLDLAQAAQ